MNRPRKEFDAIVIGAGVVGSAVARALLSKKIKKVAILDKEIAPAMHTSGRNSGVIHSGFNLKPGSLKAKFCVEGNRRLRDYCREKNLPCQIVGTVVTALNASEIPVLEEIKKRADKNGVPDVQIIDEERLKALEPYAAGVAALHSPTGSITSGEKVTHALIDDVRAKGGEIFLSEKVRGVSPEGSGVVVSGSRYDFYAPLVINCAGLYADDIAHQMGVGIGYRIVPFRGEYFQVTPNKKFLLNSMIYPVPNLAFPFLGVHWTKTIKGDVIIGPNAMIAFGKESYSFWKINMAEMAGMIFSSQFLKLMKNGEFRSLVQSQIKVSLDKNTFVAEAQKLVPDVAAEDFVRGKSGIRPQMVDSSGAMVDDILIEKGPHSVHVLNAVSPGFTCSLPFADYVVEQALS